MLQPPPRRHRRDFHRHVLPRGDDWFGYCSLLTAEGPLRIRHRCKVAWQGKDTATALKVKGLCDGAEPIPSVPEPQKNAVASDNKVFILYGHDIES
jgi:hypothetical protein